ncbi:MAG: O-antigen ligase family protein [Halothiobacillaceae bacterium]
MSVATTIRARPAAAVSGRRTGAALRPLILAVLWLGLHVALGVAFKVQPAVAVAHAGIVTLVVFLAGLAGSLRYVVGVAAYAAACHVLWRMSGAPIPWNLGFYLVFVTFTLSALRRRWQPKAAAVLSFLPLLPSALLTLEAASSLERAREQIVFNLAGPAAIFATAWVLHGRQVRLDPWRPLWLALGPIVASAGMASWYLSRQERLVFTTSSNFEASGGFGPNQVASQLSFGLLILVLYLLRPQGRKHVVLAGGLAAYLATQTLLTFSRSGAAMAMGAAFVAGVFLLRNRRARLALAGFGLVCYLLVAYVLVPGLNRFTGGAFTARYTDPSLTRRDVIARSDLELFVRNPLVGVGPGMAAEARASMIGFRAAAHTEITRLLAEHGVLGLISLFALVYLSWAVLRRARAGGGPAALSAAAGFLAWAWLYFAVNAFRTALPVLALAAAFLFARSGPSQGSARVRPACAGIGARVRKGWPGA